MLEKGQFAENNITVSWDFQVSLSRELGKVVLTCFLSLSCFLELWNPS
jgi:hypothetical protein